ncbi:hypothetical protein [Alicyclobacillus herbarius]|uniref:flagellar biosynthesis protein FlhF n=1 Tax=Alicyclobacillus herbarius TaxID=122960 RepID=UPI000418F937|nr:hypothetical protein [Alicyclobacillus herbarius]
MIVKRYVVNEMPEAVQQIRQDLGPDAVILSSRRIYSRRFWGLMKRSQIEVLAAAGAELPLQSHREVDGLVRRLERHGVRIPDLLRPGLTWAEIERLLQTRLRGQDATPLSGDARVALFLGPTGVGKTTTIAKLAALHVLAGKRVALMTTDTFRIAAVEQLQTYAQIMNAPLAVVDHLSDLPDKLQAFAGYDHVLIDTAGHNLLAPRYVLEMKRLLAHVHPDETYLVLSLTAKDEDLAAVARQLDELAYDKFLFTKWDETKTYGSVFNLLWASGRPPSYVTTGQNVPDDISLAKIADWLRWMTSEGLSG